MLKTLGHMMLSAMFIINGFKAFQEPGSRPQKVAEAGIPAPREATILNGAIMTVAGTTLALGIAPKLSALTLIATLIPTTFVGHPYWKETTPQNRANQQIHFMKNIAMIGGMIAVLVEKD